MAVDDDRTPPATDKPRGPRGGLSLGAPRRGRGRGTAPESTSLPSASSAFTSSAQVDTAVRGTDNDAVGSRISAMEAGYLPKDPYTHLLYDPPAPHFPDRVASQEASSYPTPGPSSLPARRPPIINIGTYLRCKTIDDMVSNFLFNVQGPKQIISIGAGSDSRYWRIKADPLLKDSLRQYVEIDFPEITKFKLQKVLRRRELLEALQADEENMKADTNTGFLSSSSYTLLPHDLRTLQNDAALIDSQLGHLQSQLPTLILAECVLAYLPPETSQSLLNWFGEKFQSPFGICYEMCVAGGSTSGSDSGHGTGSEKDLIPPSRFGNVMLSNLEGRKLTMPGARAYSTASSHARRFQIAFGGIEHGKEGVGGSGSKTLKEIWAHLPRDDRDRISRLEGLDEVEELEILLDHYAMSWFVKDPSLQM